MRKYQTIVTAVLAACAAAAVVGQTTAPAKPAFKNRTAVEAMRTYDAKEVEAHRAYDAVVDKARAELVKQLGAAQAQATKAGELDDAIRIRDALAELKAGVAPVKTARPTTAAATTSNLVKALSGTRWSKVDQQPQGLVTLSGDMSVLTSWHGYKGTWTLVPTLGPNVVRISLSMNSCESDTFGLSADGTKLVRENGKAAIYPRLGQFCHHRPAGGRPRTHRRR
jgi:hypothetical protein